LAVAAAMLLSLGGTVAADTSENSTSADCIGEERAERNSDGGDREHGGFGAGQAEFVQAVQPFGQWLQLWTVVRCT
jgi:hypothetical protein